MKGYVYDNGFLVFADGAMVNASVVRAMTCSSDKRHFSIRYIPDGADIFRAMPPEQEQSYRSMIYDGETVELAATGPTDEPDEPRQCITTAEKFLELSEKYVYSCPPRRDPRFDSANLVTLTLGQLQHFTACQSELARIEAESEQRHKGATTTQMSDYVVTLPPGWMAGKHRGGPILLYPPDGAKQFAVVVPKAQETTNA